MYTGYYLGSEDYYTHYRKDEETKNKGYDLHRDQGSNVTAAWEYSGEYSTFVFTKEAQKILRKHKPNDKVSIFYVILEFQRKK